MEQVNSLQEAQEWFDAHEGEETEVNCIRQDGYKRRCRSYPEAQSFFGEDTPDDRSNNEDDDGMGLAIGVGLGVLAGMGDSSDSSDSTTDTPDTSGFDSGGGDFGGAGAGSDY